MDKTNNYQSEEEIIFYEKKWYEFIKEYFVYLFKETSIFIASIITLFSATEIIMKATATTTTYKDYIIPIILLSFTIAVYRARQKQKRFIPEALIDESENTHLIFRKQKWGWHAEIARVMILKKIKAIDRSLEKIQAGTEYVEPIELDKASYFMWLKIRPERLLRLTHAIARLCIEEIPQVISHIKNEDDIKSLQEKINELENLYKYTEKFERECYSFIPPDEYKNIHEKTYGWVDPIKKGVAEFMDILLKISKVTKRQLREKQGSELSFQIVFDVLSNSSEFLNELEKIEEKSGK